MTRARPQDYLEAAGEKVAERAEKSRAMTTLVIVHEVDDVEHWRTSTRREEYFGPLGITARTFVDPDKSNRVGLIVECPSLEALQEALQGEAAADAMKFDGVRPETLQMLIEG
jgi:hypothetical protein